VKTLNFDQSDWGCVVMRGGDRVRFLQGMCTSDIDKLAEGASVRTAMLDVKGRVQSIFEVVKRADHLVLVCEPGVAEPTRDLLDRHAIMDDVELELVTQPLHRVWGAPSEVWGAAPVFAPCPSPVASAAEVEARRVEAGLPRFGVDVTTADFPFESRLRETIDYDKGCYLGQEPIARVRAQGKAKRQMVGLRVEGQAPVPVGAPVSHADRDAAGTVTSSVISADYGVIALAYLHFSVAEPGTRLRVDDRAAEAVPLPFDSAAAAL